jgi:DNA-binding transcriptional ArsR family regulator
MGTTAEPRFARVAAMIGDPTRARMLATLLDGSMVTAGEIARAANVTPPTASAHLAKLVDAGLVAVRAQGRHRYFRLADGDVAHALEALAIVAEPMENADPHRVRWSRDAMKPLRHARTCYGHLAGELGVRLHDALIAHDVLAPCDGHYEIGDDGRRWLAGLGFDAETVQASPRGIAYPCVDWSERRDHLAGPLAVALLDRFLDERWLTRVGDSRALAVNATTRRRLDRFLDLPIAR